ncbi:MAG: DUF6492 family protein [Xanthobacteraceae bacterium]
MAQAARPMMKHDVALVTPTYRNDIELFALLCDSVERHLTGYTRHYVLVKDDDVPLFAPWNSGRRVIVPSSQLLPRWLKLLPLVLRKNRPIWWSFRTKPVHGWHVQQILKIAAALQFPERRYCLVDSDNVFVRPFDLKSYAGRETTPLYVDRAAILADAPLHGPWTRNCDRLLGRSVPTIFPADDYVGNAIIWDQQTVRDMTRRSNAPRERAGRMPCAASGISRSTFCTDTSSATRRPTWPRIRSPPRSWPTPIGTTHPWTPRRSPQCWTQ